MQYTLLQGNSGAFSIKTVTGDVINVLYLQQGGLKVSHSTGDISFYEDTGTTPKFFWDASAESLGIGTTSPASKLHINSGTANQAATFESTDAIAIVGFKDNTTSNLIATGANGNNFVFYNGERLRIDSAGNVGLVQLTKPLHLAQTQ